MVRMEVFVVITSGIIEGLYRVLGVLVCEVQDSLLHRDPGWDLPCSPEPVCAGWVSEQAGGLRLANTGLQQPVSRGGAGWFMFQDTSEFCCQC